MLAQQSLGWFVCTWPPGALFLPITCLCGSMVATVLRLQELVWPAGNGNTRNFCLQMQPLATDRNVQGSEPPVPSHLVGTSLRCVLHSITVPLKNWVQVTARGSVLDQVPGFLPVPALHPTHLSVLLVTLPDETIPHLGTCFWGHLWGVGALADCKWPK